MTSTAKEYSKTFTSFGGSDVIAVLNNTVVGEWQGYDYIETLGWVYDDNGNPTHKNKFQGHMDVVVFDRTTFRDLLKKEDNEFTLLFGNEYGQKCVVEFKNIIFTHRKGGVSVDNITMQEKYFFTSDDIVMSPKQWRFDPAAGYIVEENIDGTKQ